MENKQIIIIIIIIIVSTGNKFKIRFQKKIWHDKGIVDNLTSFSLCYA